MSDGVKWEDGLVFTVAAKMFRVSCLREPQAGLLRRSYERVREKLPKQTLRELAGCVAGQPAMPSMVITPLPGGRRAAGRTA